MVFKRQKYHCVYEYPREVTAECEASPARLPDYSTYAGKLLYSLCMFLCVSFSFWLDF